MGISDWSSDVCSSDLEFVGGMGQDVIGGIELLEPAVPEQGNLVAHLHGLVDVVADEQNGFPQLPLHFQEFILDDFAIDRVDRAKRFVHQQNRRVGRKAEEHTSELQSLMRIPYDVFCLKKKKNKPLQP